MTLDHGVLDHPTSSRLPAGDPVHPPPARRSARGGGPWRYLWAGATFAAIALLAAAATLALLDWVVFDTPVVAPRLRVGGQGLPREKLLMAPRYRDARVLYLGDSRILVGVDPTVVSEACGCGPGYNGAFAAADPRLTRIMAGQLLRTLSPEVVVIGVSQWELSDEANILLYRPALELVPPWQLAELDITLDDREERIDATVSAVWRLYRYRREVRATLDPSGPELPSSGELRNESRRGFYVNSAPRRHRERGLDERQQRWFTDFSVEGRRTEALRGLLADLRGRGVRVVLVAPPLHRAFHARVRREVQAFRAAVEQLAAESGATFLDLTAPERSGLTNAHFQDFVHLDEAGATRFSRFLGEAIRSRLDGA